MFVILSISDSDKHFLVPIQEYEKRLGKSLVIDNLKPFKDDNVQLVIEKETESLSKILHKKYLNYHKILLIKEWWTYDTLEFSEMIQGENVVFIIGWPYGVDEKRLKSDFSDLIMLSLGKMTFPHGLAKLLLIEQIYRATTLWSGKKYHY